MVILSILVLIIIHERWKTDKLVNKVFLNRFREDPTSI